MPISLQCPGCGKGYTLRDELAGKRVKCGCGTETTVAAAPTSPRKAPQADTSPLSSPTAGLLRRRKRWDQGSNRWRTVVGVLSIVYGTVMTPLILVGEFSTGPMELFNTLVRACLAVMIAVGGVLILRRHRHGPACAGLSCLFLCFFRLWILLILLLAAFTTADLRALLVGLLATVALYSVPVFITVWCLNRESEKTTDAELPL